MKRVFFTNSSDINLDYKTVYYLAVEMGIEPEDLPELKKSQI